MVKFVGSGHLYQGVQVFQQGLSFPSGPLLCGIFIVEEALVAILICKS